MILDLILFGLHDARLYFAVDSSPEPTHTYYFVSAREEGQITVQWYSSINFAQYVRWHKADFNSQKYIQRG